MLSFLEGKRTYICAAALAGAYFLQLIGVISADTYNVLLGLGGPMGLASLRAAAK